MASTLGVRRSVGRRRQQGVTLIELIVVLTVLAVFVTIAVPSFQATFERQRVSGAAQALYGDLQFARAESIKRNQNVYVVFDDSNTAQWCYGIDDASAASCSCGSATGCTVNGQQQIVSFDRFPSVEVSSNLTSDWVRFDPVRGVLSPAGTVTLTPAGSSSNIKVVLSLMGRVRLCSDNGYAGYESC